MFPELAGNDSATFECPDVSICIHCGRQIFWAEYTYIHNNGWADCGGYVNDAMALSSSYARQMSPVQLAELCATVCGLFT